MIWRGEPQWSGATSDYHRCKLENNLVFYLFAAIQNNEAVKFLSKMILIFLIFSITGYNALPPNDMEATMTHLANVVSTINNITNVVSKQNSTDDHPGSNFACIPQRK